jgi:hypothetical protein
VQVTLLFAQDIEDSVLDKNSIHFKLQKGLFHSQLYFQPG